MPTVFWYRLPDPATGELQTAPRKATEAMIEAIGGERMLGSAQEVEDAELDAEGFYTPPYEIER